MRWSERGVLVWLGTGGLGEGWMGERCLHCLWDDDEVVSTMSAVRLLPVSRILNRVYPMSEA